MSISKPVVILKKEGNVTLEPFEEVIVDCDEEFSGSVINKLTQKKGAMQGLFPHGIGKVRIVFHIPTRGLVGYHSEFLTSTRGTGLLNRSFLEYREYVGDIEGRKNGVLISNDQGDATAYSLFHLEDRGIMFIAPGTKVYKGMIIGENSKENDLEVNVVRGKELTNMRASGKDDAVKCKPYKQFTIEEAITYMKDDEWLEVTPKFLRLRKRYLDPNERKMHKKN